MAKSDVGTTHEVYKNLNGPPSTCAETWTFTAPEDGVWYAHVVNEGMRWIIIDMVDEDTSDLVIDREMYRFAVWTNEFDTPEVPVTGGHDYSITVTPNGPLYTRVWVTDMFEGSGVPNVAPTAAFSFNVDGDTVSVDASASDDSDGEIVSYEWTWGDGTTGTGMTATHVYEPPSFRNDPPGTPYPVGGYTYAADGVTKLLGCSVIVKNNSTGYSWTTSSSTTSGFYAVVIYATAGDVIYVQAVLDDLYGDAEAVAAGTSLQVNVTLEGEAPPEPEPFDFLVTLKVTDDDGAVATLSKTVTVWLIVP
jgi:hypothetical protein